MNSSLLQVVAIAVGLAMTAPALAATAPSYIATVNGVAIPKSYVDAIVDAQAQQGTPDSKEQRAAITDRLIELEVLSQEARKKGLDKNPELKAQLTILRMQAYANAYAQDYLQNHPVSDAAAKAEYDRLRSESGDKDYKARHILLDTEDEAKGIIARLKLGEKFEELAKGVEGCRHEGQGRRTRLEHGERLRETVFGRHGEAREGSIHRHAGAIPVWLARHPPRRHPPRQVPRIRRGEGPAQAEPAAAGTAEGGQGVARQGEDPNALKMGGLTWQPHHV